MANEMRAGALALFFVLGMAFMAAIFILANPQWADHERVREGPRLEKSKLVFVEESAPANPPPAPQMEVVEENTPPPVEKEQRAAEAPAKAATPPEPPIAEPTATVASAPSSPQTNSTATTTRAPNRPLSMANLGGPGTLRGRVFFVGAPPPEKPLPLDVGCADLTKDQRPTTRFYVIGPEKGLADVVVRVVSPIPKRHWIVPADPLVIAAFRCRFEPYVAAAQAGQRLLIENRDPLMHNAHIIDSQGHGIDFAMLPKSKPRELLLEHTQELKIKCDVHPWEFAYVTVVEHPFFAVTDAEGKFEIKGLPARSYIVEAVHRKARTNTLMNIEVGKNGGFAEFQFN